MWEQWKGTIAVISGLLGIGSMVVAGISSYGNKAAVEGRSELQLELVNDAVKKHDIKINALDTGQTELRVQINELKNGQSRVEQGQKQVIQGQELTLESQRRVEQAIRALDKGK